MPKIETMYAFITEDKSPDDEGIIGIDTPLGWMPLVGGDMKRVESLRPIAVNIAKQLGKRVKILQFETRKEIGVIEP
jgi:hypothetical protein